jgi:DNA-directed RNA polymerase specialized sigma24 family protein
MSGCNPQNERIEQLFREMFKTLYIYAKNALGEHSLAEDATQETFCTACAKSDECLQSGNPEGWLMKTLKNVVRNTRRCLKIGNVPNGEGSFRQTKPI